MEQFLQSATFNYILLSILLVILGLWLKGYNPPIKEQWQVLALVTVGGILGYFMVGNVAIGICISGLVFYKDKLIEEIMLLKDSISILKDVKDEDNEKSDNKGDEK